MAEVDYALKLFIRDISKVEMKFNSGKVSYLFSGINFRKLMIQGIVTKIYPKDQNVSRYELSDATDSIIICIQDAQNGLNDMKIKKNLEAMERKSDVNNSKMLETLQWMYYTIEAKCELSFQLGDCLAVTGKIITDIVHDQKAVLAFEYDKMSLESDLIWMLDLSYIYQTHYHKKSKSNENDTDLKPI